jgi:hypothetical protein
MYQTHLAAKPTANPSATEPAGCATAVISTTGDLDDAAAARLLRWCEARLHLLDIEHAPLNHLLVDVHHARHATPSAAAILDHARVEAARRHVEIHLVGAGQIMISSSLPVRQRLGRWNAFPTLDDARATLTPKAADGADHPTHRPVDPDAIALTPAIHERLY